MGEQEDDDQDRAFMKPDMKIWAHDQRAGKRHNDYIRINGDTDTYTTRTILFVFSSD